MARKNGLTITLVVDKALVAAMKKEVEKARDALEKATVAGADVVRAEIEQEFERRRVSGEAATNFATKPGNINDKDGLNAVVTLAQRGKDREYPFFMEFGVENRQRGGTLPKFGLMRAAYDRTKEKATETTLTIIRQEMGL